MQLKKLFKDDDAVSPVIGVILMVAITVILAAVIASFVLGLGSTSDAVQPNSSFSLDISEDASDNDVVTLTVTDGDTLDFDELIFRGDGISENVALSDSTDIQEEGGTDALEGTWEVGESISFSDDGSEADYIFESADWEEGNTVNLVWEESGGDASATIYDFDIPE